MALKDSIVGNLDLGNHCVLYSLDLSAAFDMLRVDLFHDMFKSVIPDGLLKIIVDFLVDRNYFVKVGDSSSIIVNVDRGCPQGSILGPVLFNLYVGRCLEGLENCRIVSYADDTYVVNIGKTLDEAIKTTNSNITRHTANLKNIGMVVNETKTEIVVFSKDAHAMTEIVLEDGIALKTAKKIKALGILDR